MSNKIYDIDDINWDNEDELSSDEIKTAMIELSKGLSWEESSINPKTVGKSDGWDELVDELKETKKNGWTIDNPSDFP